MGILMYHLRPHFTNPELKKLLSRVDDFSLRGDLMDPFMTILMNSRSSVIDFDEMSIRYQALQDRVITDYHHKLRRVFSDANIQTIQSVYLDLLTSLSLQYESGVSQARMLMDSMRGQVLTVETCAEMMGGSYVF